MASPLTRRKHSDPPEGVSSAPGLKVRISNPPAGDPKTESKSRHGYGAMDGESTRKLVVLVPTKNEIWCIEAFLKSASLWADLIVVRDQGSNDGTREVVAGYPKAVLVDNPSLVYNERENRSALLQKARELAGVGNVLISLDADERLTPAILNNELREKILRLPPGSGIKIPFANVTASGEEYWKVAIDPIAWVDDGRESDITAPIHFPRTCISKFDQIFEFEGLFTIHLQYLDESRFQKKQVWYILKEVQDFNKRNLVFIFRRYMHVLGVDNKTLRLLPESWRDEYFKRGVDIFYSRSAELDWRESDVQQLLAGLSQRDLNKLPRKYFGERQRLGPIEAVMHTYLEFSQRVLLRSHRSVISIWIRILDYPLSLFWRAASRSRRDPNRRN